MTAVIKSHFWTIFFSLAVVLGLQPLVPLAVNYYSDITPVVNMQGVIIERSHESVVIHIHGEKLRVCRFVQMTAMTVDGSGVLVEAYLEKMGKPIDGSTKPVGSFDLGRWKVWPISGSTKAVVFVQHDCDGVVKLSKVAEVTL